MEESQPTPSDAAPTVGGQPDAAPSVAREPPAAPTGVPEPAPAPAPAPALERLARWTSARLSHPNVRTALAGVALILVGALLVTGSFWTFPVTIVGVVMVVVAWVGRRLEGRFAFEWGEFGAGFELRARIKAPPHPLRRAELLGFDAAQGERQLVTGAGRAAGDPPDALVEAAREWVQDAETIEEEAHTVTVDHLDQLRAAVSAAELVADEPID